MAVPKTTVGMAVCRKDRAYKHYTNNPIPTSFFVCDILLSLFSEMTQWETTLSMKKNDVGMGIFV